MLIILKETIRKLGTVGDVVTVRRGFARNFLLPQNKAVRATKANLHELSLRQDKVKAQQNEEIAKADALRKEIEKIDVLPIFARVESGKLFGSVGIKQITSALSEKGIDIASKSIILASSIKEAGEHDIKVFLHTQVACVFKIHILDVSKAEKKQGE